MIDHEEIKNYPLEFQDQIRSSIFRSADHKDMNISKETIKEYFNNSNKVPTGRGRFLKKIEITCIQRNGDNFLILCKFCI